MRLKELRINKKLLQKDVASAVGIERTTYVKYENGQSEPSIDILKRIASFYEVSIDYLVGYSDAVQSLDVAPPVMLASEKEIELMNIFRQLNSTGQSILLKNARSLIETAEMRQEGPMSSMA